jgi:hypothetical protein
MDFYQETLRVVKAELPGIRGDLHRKISREIAATLSQKVRLIADENKRLAASGRQLQAALQRAAPRRGIAEIERALLALEQARKKINGEENG